MKSLKLPSYATHLLAEVQRVSGYPISLVEADAVGFDSQLRLARPGSERHEVTYVHEYEEYATHFLVSAARKVIRLYTCPPDERLMPSYDAGRRLPADQEAELRQNFGPRLDEEGVRAISQLLFSGTVQQLTSFPVDLRVERELYDELLEHRPLQQAYLRRQMADIEPHFSAEIEGPAPSRVYAATTAMNVVLAEEAAELGGQPIGPLVRSTPHRAMGTRLRQILREEETPGLPRRPAGNGCVGGSAWGAGVV